MIPPLLTALALHRIFISDGHTYFGRHGQGSAGIPIREVDAAECVAGCGIRGDRFFNYKPDYKGQISLFSREIFLELRRTVGAPNASPAALRRNLLVSGLPDLNELIGQQFDLQGVRLVGTEECKPCYWMDEAIGPGAHAWLKGRGGLRCRILSTGWLKAGSN